MGEPLLAGMLTIASMLAGCGAFHQNSSPDVIYSRDAEAARALQVPPDLTDVSDGEQFVLPGAEGGALTRDTLLPVFERARFVREGAIAWLEFDVAPEALWPRLLGFLRHEKFRIDETEPTAGTLFTRWRAASEVGAVSLLDNLIGSEQFTRVGFRLERASGGSRLFARVQSASEEIARDGRDVPLGAGSSDPEESAALLARLLVFFGVAEQRANGIIDARRAASVLEEAVLADGPAGGSQLVINRGFASSFQAVDRALDVLEHEVTSSDDGVGRIEYRDASAAYVLTLVPLHVGAVRVSLGDANGRPLAPEREREALEALRTALIT